MRHDKVIQTCLYLFQTLPISGRMGWYPRKPVLLLFLSIFDELRSCHAKLMATQIDKKFWKNKKHFLQVWCAKSDRGCYICNKPLQSLLKRVSYVCYRSEKHIQEGSERLCEEGLVDSLNYRTPYSCRTTCNSDLVMSPIKWYVAKTTIY